MATLADLIDRFVDDVAKRSSPATVSHYRKRLAAFKRGLGNTLLPGSELGGADPDHGQPGQPVPELLTADRVTALIDAESRFSSGSRAGELKAPDTIRATITVWEQFQKWLKSQRLLRSDITAKIRKPGGRKRELLPTKDETRRLLEKSEPDFHSIYRALRLTGARPGELCKAQISDWDRTAGEIVLSQHKTAKKTGKSRRIAVGHDALIAILSQATVDRVAGNIFLRSSGIPWTSDSLSAAYRDARKAAGLRDGLVLYLSRHEHGTELYRRTEDLKAVADALGHSGLTNTIRYTRIDGDKLKKNQQLFDEDL